MERVSFGETEQRQVGDYTEVVIPYKGDAYVALRSAVNCLNAYIFDRHNWWMNASVYDDTCSVVPLRNTAVLSRRFPRKTFSFRTATVFNGDIEQRIIISSSHGELEEETLKAFAHDIKHRYVS
jgi:hypothetical protein